MLNIGDKLWYYVPTLDGKDFHFGKIIAISEKLGYYILNENKEMLWVSNWIDSSLEVLKERIQIHQEYCKNLIEPPIENIGYVDFIPKQL